MFLLLSVLLHVVKLWQGVGVCHKSTQISMLVWCGVVWCGMVYVVCVCVCCVCVCCVCVCVHKLQIELVYVVCANQAC